MPGFRLSMSALSNEAAKLMQVDIVVPEQAMGKTTASQLQSGLFYSQLGGVKALLSEISDSHFPDELPVMIATGGYAHLLDHTGLFDANVPDLVFHGLRLIWQKMGKSSS